MGSFDVVELVGLYFVSVLRKEFGDNKTGLHRDDELSCFQNFSGPESIKIKKKKFTIFKQHGLNITI